MASHHFIGSGRNTRGFAAEAAQAEGLLDGIQEVIHRVGFAVVARKSARFPGGGMTLVWILAESHLVLHYWAEEGFSTIDLHICDYSGSNATKARQLVDELTTRCFEPGSIEWRELSVPEPVGTVAH